MSVCALTGATACASLLGIDATEQSDEPADASVEIDAVGSPPDASPLVCELPQVACGDTCREVQRDPANCGECGHECASGACAEGRCQPTVVAAGTTSAYSLAVVPDGSQVFWVEPQFVRRCPAAGCSTPSTVAEFVALGLRRDLDQIVATTQQVLWLGNNTPPQLLSCPAAGCPMQIPQVLPGRELDIPRGLTLLSDTVVVAQRFNVQECQLNGSCATTCAGGDSIQSATADTTAIYWIENTDPAGLYSCPRAGGADLRLTSERGDLVRLSNGELFVMSAVNGRISSCRVDGCSGAATDFVTGELGISGLSVTDTGVYWSTAGSDVDPTGQIKMCPRSGCGAEGPTVLAIDQARPTELTVVGPDIFWLNRGVPAVTDSAAVMRLQP